MVHESKVEFPFSNQELNLALYNAITKKGAANYEQIRMLLEHGAAPTYYDELGNCTLHYVAYAPQESVLTVVNFFRLEVKWGAYHFGIDDRRQDALHFKRIFNSVLAVPTLNDRQRRSGSYFGLKKNSGQGSRDEGDRSGTGTDQVRPAIPDSGHYIVG